MHFLLLLEISSLDVRQFNYFCSEHEVDEEMPFFTHSSITWNLEKKILMIYHIPIILKICFKCSGKEKASLFFVLLKHSIPVKMTEKLLFLLSKNHKLLSNFHSPVVSFSKKTSPWCQFWGKPLHNSYIILIPVKE